MLTAIVNVNESWGIGRRGDLLVSIPGDMKFFRETTRGSVVIMGRKTLESFPGGLPLKDRVNVVLTRDPSRLSPEAKSGVVTAGSPAELPEILELWPERRAFVIGGATVYRDLLPYCDTCLVTRNDSTVPADTFFPDLDADPEWALTDESEAREYEGILYRFCTYKRISGGRVFQKKL